MAALAVVAPQLSQIAARPASQPFPATVPQYWRAPEVAKRLNLSAKTVQRYFAKDPDVLHMGERKRGTRAYTTLLIPESSILRFIERMKRRHAA